MFEKYEAIIGLEVHAQLLTKSKAFCSCSTEYGALPNTNTCPVCLGHPGTLPVLNENLVNYIVKMGLATNCKVRNVSTFSRKNYFYQDLPKGYQISQYEDPICYDGHLNIETSDGKLKHIGITRIHMEEDTGKSIHDLDVDTLLDLNRAGVPLIEIVSGPDIRSAEEAYQYLMQIRQIVMYLNICNGNMEEAALRCDANVSVRLRGTEKFGTKVEVKNMNSFRNVEKAIDYEIKRQIEFIEAGGVISQETRMWDGGKNVTKSMRSKEMAHDYRYFQEPDMLAVHVSHAHLEEITKWLPELPLARKQRLVAQYSIPAYDAGIFVEEQELADYYEKTCSLLNNQNEKTYKLCSNWIMTEIMRIKSEKNIAAKDIDVDPAIISELVDMIDQGMISSAIAKEVFPEALENKRSPKSIVEEKGLIQITDTSFIEELVSKVIAENPENLAKYQSGRTNLFGFFVGQVIKQSQGKANPQMASDFVKKQLDALSVE
jgi:aspartyl-tRNA(Asn)/glutamyl-tRNA(Gln) amidotransferase subunit B